MGEMDCANVVVALFDRLLIAGGEGIDFYLYSPMPHGVT